VREMTPSGKVGAVLKKGECLRTFSEYTLLERGALEKVGTALRGEALSAFSGQVRCYEYDTGIQTETGRVLAKGSPFWGAGHVKEVAGGKLRAVMAGGREWPRMEREGLRSKLGKRRHRAER